MFRLVGTAESLCVGCFLAAHPPAPVEPRRAGCLSDLRKRSRRTIHGHCRSTRR
jgi:hypothetical protein